MVSALLLIFSACLLGLVSSRIAPLYEAEHAELHFERFIEQYNRNYAHEHEKQARFKIFKDNLEKINQFNEESTHARFGVTQFSDLTPEEFAETYLGAFQSANFTKGGCKDVSDDQISDVDAPESFDWRSKNVVTRVKNQKRCGSCYAFSSTGNIEGQYAIRYKRLSEFSEQQIIDCDRGSNGCRGGFMPSAFVTLINQGGLELESSYPYRAVQGRCNFQPGKAMVRLTGCNSYSPSSQDKLKQILFAVGPIAIGVKASNFQHYRGGIMTDNFCGWGNVDHAVLLVGYGTENGHPYWLVKNSWGESFGESGYFRVSRAPGADSCGLFNELMSSAVVM